ncbi:MAG TPA: hypothetical protein VK659_10265 [Asanoa sp.]|nr:hypothetical protein [Asanoa sp.]
MPQTTSALAERRAIYNMLNGGIVYGLPVPRSINFYDHNDGGHSVSVQVDDNDPEAVQQWALFLRCESLPAFGPLVTGNGVQPFRAYRSEKINPRHPDAPDWTVEASSYIDEPKPDPR